MNKIILFFSVFTLLLTSCSNDENATPSEDTSILPKTISYSYPNIYLGTNTTSTINYLGNRIVSTTEAGKRTVFTYEGNFITKQQQFKVDDKGIETKNIEVIYSYENGKLKTRLIKKIFEGNYPDGMYIYKTVYTHRSDILVSYVIYLVDPTTKVETKDAEGSLAFREGNLVKSIQTADSSTVTRTFEYDTKNNPLKNILGFGLLLNEISEYGKNNVIKTTSSSSEFPTPTNYVTSYIYNDNDFPTKHTSFTGNNTTSIEYEIEYTY